MRVSNLTGGRYRGRHRKPRPLGMVRAARAGVLMACAGLFVCWPQASWADHSGTVAAHSARAHAVVTSHVTVQRRPGLFGQLLHR
jgi:hypothetical protein